MTVFWTMIAGIAACVAAYATFQMMLQGFWPDIMVKHVIGNNKPRPVFLTRLYSRCGTFSTIERDGTGRGFFADSGQSEIPLNVAVCCGDKYEIQPKYLYVNGEQREYYVELHLDFRHGFNFRTFRIEAIPLPSTP